MTACVQTFRMNEVGKAFWRCGIVCVKLCLILLDAMLQYFNHSILVCLYCFIRAYLDEFLHKNFKEEKVRRKIEISLCTGLFVEALQYSFS